MSSSILPKSELVALVLAEIRKCEGCEGVDSVVIQETRHPWSAANWEICIIAASSGDPAVVQRASAAVQKSLQLQYHLSDGKLHQFRVGDRVRLSELGLSRARRKRTTVGTVSVENRWTVGDNVCVLFDGSKKPIRLHHTFVEPIGSD